jgi:hypothetical protein
MTKTGPSMQRFSRELAATAVPLMVAIVLLGLFTIPNYLRAREWSREASSLRAVANEAAARQDNLLDIQREIERLRAELAQRGRTLPAAPDQGALLGSIARSADAKGVTSSQSKSGKLALISVPGLVGGKAMRRAVDVEMSGSFEALFAIIDLEGASYRDIFVRVDDRRIIQGVHNYKDICALFSRHASFDNIGARELVRLEKLYGIALIAVTTIEKHCHCVWTIRAHFNGWWEGSTFFAIYFTGNREIKNTIRF